MKICEKFDQILEKLIAIRWILIKVHFYLNLLSSDRVTIGGDKSP